MTMQPQAVAQADRTDSGRPARTLVVYYSRTGTTRAVAEAIAERLEGDVEELIDTRKRKGPWGFLVAIRDATKKRMSPIRPVQKRPADYDLVVVGTPVWASTMSSAVRAYLTDCAAEIRKVALFCTQAGKSPGHTFADMEELCGRPPVATLSLRAKLVKAGQFAPMVDEFAEKLRQG